MVEFRQIRIGAVSWLAFVYCLLFLFIYFYMYLFKFLIMDQLGYDLFSTESGALCHLICACIGACIVLYLAERDQEMNIKYKECLELAKTQKEN